MADEKLPTLTRRQKSFASHVLHVLNPEGHPVDPWADDAPEGPPRTRIPKLTIQSIPKYIAAVAKALERGQLKPAEANAMLYAAQMLLTAWRVAGEALPDEAPAEKRIGFIQAADDALQREVSMSKRKPRLPGSKPKPKPKPKPGSFIQHKGQTALGTRRP